jgi:hypothetical protein
MGAMGGFFGIPMSAKQSLFQMAQIPINEQLQLLDDIQLIEDGALQVINSKDEK